MYFFERTNLGLYPDFWRGWKIEISAEMVLQKRRKFGLQWLNMNILFYFLFFWFLLIGLEVMLIQNPETEIKL